MDNLWLKVENIVAKGEASESVYMRERVKGWFQCNDARCNIFQLYKLGFENLHALEPSDAMIDKAEEKQVYRRIYKSFMTDKKTEELCDGKFCLYADAFIVFYSLAYIYQPIEWYIQ